jgi:hypothetical protein
MHNENGSEALKRKLIKLTKNLKRWTHKAVCCWHQGCQMVGIFSYKKFYFWGSWNDNCMYICGRSPLIFWTQDDYLLDNTHDQPVYHAQKPINRCVVPVCTSVQLLLSGSPVDQNWQPWLTCVHVGTRGKSSSFLSFPMYIWRPAFRGRFFKIPYVRKLGIQLKNRKFKM